MLLLANLSFVAVALILAGDPRPVNPPAHIAESDAIPSEIPIATITELVPSAVITTDAAPSAGKGAFPSYLRIEPRKKEIHKGGEIRDGVTGRVISRTAYGYSQIFDYTVLDQKGNPFRRGGMKAREEVTRVAGNVDSGAAVATPPVTINEDGKFSDVQALFTESFPPLPAGSFLKFKQKVIITYKNQDYLLGVVCIEQRVDEVVLTAFANINASCK